MVSGGAPTRFHGQYPPQVKEKLFLNDIFCLKGRIRSYLRSRPPRTESHEANTTVQ